eukprot:1705633-Rhodomonas_salina.1
MAWRELEVARDRERKAKARGTEFQMVAWPILNRMRATYTLDTTVGPTALEAPPRFQHWLTPSTGYDIAAGACPLVFLDAISSHLHSSVLEQMSLCDKWVLVEKVTNRGDTTAWLVREGVRHYHESVPQEMVCRGARGQEDGSGGQILGEEARRSINGRRGGGGGSTYSGPWGSGQRPPVQVHARGLGVVPLLPGPPAKQAVLAMDPQPARGRAKRPGGLDRRLAQGHGGRERPQGG